MIERSFDLQAKAYFLTCYPWVFIQLFVVIEIEIRLRFQLRHQTLGEIDSGKTYTPYNCVRKYTNSIRLQT